MKQKPESHFARLFGVAASLLKLCLFLIFLFPPVARCQFVPVHTVPVDLSVNYSFLRAYPDGNGTPFNSNGGSLSGSWPLTPSLAVVADFGGYQFGGQQSTVSGRLLTYTGGVRYSLSRRGSRFRSFAQALAGGARVSGSVNGQSAGENGLAAILGGGIDVSLRPRIAFRAIQFDYLLTHCNRIVNSEGIQNDFRISAGLVFSFGHYK